MMAHANSFFLSSKDLGALVGFLLISIPWGYNELLGVGLSSEVERREYDTCAHTACLLARSICFGLGYGLGFGPCL